MTGKSARTLDFKVIPRPEAGGQEPDAFTKSEVRALEQEAKLCELERQRMLLKGATQDVAERKLYANRVFLLVVWWLIAVLAFVFLSATGRSSEAFYVSDPVLIALITTSTGSVLGLFFLVMKYLFSSRSGAG